MKEHVEYDLSMIRRDMAAKGWLPIDLAKRAGISHMTVGRFLSGERQTARMAKRIATALGQSVRRYLAPAQFEARA